MTTDSTTVDAATSASKKKPSTASPTNVSIGRGVN
jgi:hypothetical protein